MAKFVVPMKMSWAADSIMAPPQQLFLGPADGFVVDGEDFVDPDEVVEMLEVKEEVVEEEVVEEVVEEEVVEVLEDKPKKKKKSSKKK